jgi:hypothetical protein
MKSTDIAAGSLFASGLTVARKVTEGPQSMPRHPHLVRTDWIPTTGPSQSHTIPTLPSSVGTTGSEAYEADVGRTKTSSYSGARRRSLRLDRREADRPSKHALPRRNGCSTCCRRTCDSLAIRASRPTDDQTRHVDVPATYREPLMVCQP